MRARARPGRASETLAGRACVAYPRRRDRYPHVGTRGSDRTCPPDQVRTTHALERTAQASTAEAKGYVGRTLQARIKEVYWESPFAKLVLREGSRLKMIGLGWAYKRGELVPLKVEGTRLEVAKRTFFRWRTSNVGGWVLVARVLEFGPRRLASLRCGPDSSTDPNHPCHVAPPLPAAGPSTDPPKAGAQPGPGQTLSARHATLTAKTRLSQSLRRPPDASSRASSNPAPVPCPVARRGRGPRPGPPCARGFRGRWRRGGVAG